MSRSQFERRPKPGRMARRVRSEPVRTERQTNKKRPPPPKGRIARGATFFGPHVRRTRLARYGKHFRVFDTASPVTAGPAAGAYLPQIDCPTADSVRFRSGRSEAHSAKRPRRLAPTAGSLKLSFCLLFFLIAQFPYFALLYRREWNDVKAKRRYRSRTRPECTPSSSSRTRPGLRLPGPAPLQ